MADRQIKILQPSDAVLFEDHGMISRRLVRSDHGSPNLSFHVSTMPEGYDDQNVVYPEHDEVVYMLAGTVEVALRDTGARATLTPGMALFIPRGASYGYRVVKGPNEVIAVFSPAKV